MKTYMQLGFVFSLGISTIYGSYIKDIKKILLDFDAFL